MEFRGRPDHQGSRRLPPPGRGGGIASFRRGRFADHRNLAAAIATVAVFGLSIGESAPLLSLLLERRGTDPTVNGLNAGAAFIGVLIGPLLTPMWVRRVGLRMFLLGSLIADMTVFMAMKPLNSLAAWFVLRMLLGLIGSGLFTASEAWINLLATDAIRGRVLGIYAAALSAGFGLGPLVLSVTGIAGWPPFLANTAMVGLAIVPLLSASDDTRDLGRERAANPLVFMWRAKLIVAVVALFGLFESAMFSLFPIWGVRSGLSVPEASALVSAVYLGGAMLQVPVGFLSDKITRPNALRVCGVIGILGAGLLIALPQHRTTVYPLALLWGGTVAGIYSIALGMAGDRFAGRDMVPANAAIIIGYGLGGLAGPGLGGLSIDLWDPQGLPAMFATLFVILLALTLVPARR